MRVSLLLIGATISVVNGSAFEGGKQSANANPPVMKSNAPTTKSEKSVVAPTEGKSIIVPSTARRTFALTDTAVFKTLCFHIKSMITSHIFNFKTGTVDPVSEVDAREWMLLAYVVKHVADRERYQRILVEAVHAELKEFLDYEINYVRIVEEKYGSITPTPETVRTQIWPHLELMVAKADRDLGKMFTDDTIRVYLSSATWHMINKKFTPNVYGENSDLHDVYLASVLLPLSDAEFIERISPLIPAVMNQAYNEWKAELVQQLGTPPRLDPVHFVPAYMHLLQNYFSDKLSNGSWHKRRHDYTVCTGIPPLLKLFMPPRDIADPIEPVYATGRSSAVSVAIDHYVVEQCDNIWASRGTPVTRIAIDTLYSSHWAILEYTVQKNPNWRKDFPYIDLVVAKWAETKLGPNPSKADKQFMSELLPYRLGDNLTARYFVEPLSRIVSGIKLLFGRRENVAKVLDAYIAYQSEKLCDIVHPGVPQYEFPNSVAKTFVKIEFVEFYRLGVTMNQVQFIEAARDLIARHMDVQLAKSTSPQSIPESIIRPNDDRIIELFYIPLRRTLEEFATSVKVF